MGRQLLTWQEYRGAPVAQSVSAWYLYDRNIVIYQTVQEEIYLRAASSMKVQ